MNSSEWLENSTSPNIPLTPLGLVPSGSELAGGGDSPDVTGATVAVSDKPCGEALSSQTPSPVRMPGSLDALLYIVIVLMFYAFSIVVLMVKYIRREREEANLRNYYHEFVSRDKFRSAQFKNRQFMSRIFGRSTSRGKHTMASIEEVAEDEPSNSPRERRSSVGKGGQNQAQTITKRGNTFSRLLLESENGEKHQKGKESFTFLGAKNQFCKNGFFGRKFCNKQLCSKCVSEGAPTIDWGDERGAVERTCSNLTGKDVIEVTVLNSGHKNTLTVHNSVKKNQCASERERRLSLERDNHIFFPIIECDSDKEKEDAAYWGTAKPKSEKGPARADHANRAYLEENALVSSCSMEVSELLANMPPLGGDGSIDMDTLDGLSNLDSEVESQSLLNYSSSLRGVEAASSLLSDNFGRGEGDRRSNRPLSDHFGSLHRSESGRNYVEPTIRPRMNGSLSNTRVDLFSEDKAKDFSDVLSERTSLLSCTLSLADVDDDLNTNLSSSKHLPNGFASSGSSNGKIRPHFMTHIKEESKTNGKSSCLLDPLSKSMGGERGEEEDVLKLLNDITFLTEDSGVFRNLKYFLRSFSRTEDDTKDQPHEKSTLLPKETYFGPGSPKSFFGDPAISDLSAQADGEPFSDGRTYSRPPSVVRALDEDLINIDSSEKDYGNRWGYAYDDDDIFSDRSSSLDDHSSSFGDYCMGQTSDSQVIDLSKPLARRQFDTDTTAGLSRAFIGLCDPCDPWVEKTPAPAYNKRNPMVAGYGPARKETKV